MTEETVEEQERFEATVEEVMHRDGLSFILALYKVIDELTAQGVQAEAVKPACHAGCSFCCHQLVSCTDLEWDAIKQHVESFPGKKAYSFRKRARRLMVEWKRYWEKYSQAVRLGLRSPHMDWAGKPCPFLGEDQTCAIYPVRPIDCRTMSSTIVCTNMWKQPGASRMRFPWERWANNWILEEEALAQGKDLRSIKVYLFLDRLDNTPNLWT